MSTDEMLQIPCASCLAKNHVPPERADQGPVCGSYKAHHGRELPRQSGSMSEPSILGWLDSLPVG